MSKLILLTNIAGGISPDPEKLHWLNEVYDRYSQVVYSLVAFAEVNGQKAMELHVIIFREIALEYKNNEPAKQKLFMYIWNITVNSLRSKGYILDRDFFRTCYNIG